MGLEHWLGEFEWAPVFGYTPPVILGGVAAAFAFGLTLASRNLRPGFGRVLAGLLRACFILVLVFLLWNPVREKEVGKEVGETVFLVDRSESMSLGDVPRLREAQKWMEKVADEMDKTKVLFFAEEVGQADWAEVKAEGRPTRLAAALRRAGEEAGQEGQVVVVGDGRGHDQRDLPATLSELGSKEVRVYTKVVGKDSPLGNAWLQNLRVARTVKPGQEVQVQLSVGMTGLKEQTAILRLRDGTEKVLHEELVHLREGQVQLGFKVKSGLRSETWELALEEVEDDRIEEDSRVSFPIQVKDPKLKVLYLEGTHAMRYVTDGAKAGNWNECEFKTRSWDAAGDIDWALYTPLSQYASEENLHRVKGFADGRFVFDQARGFPQTREELFRYDVVICGDIPRGNFTDEQMNWLVELVTLRGGGFCMIGGYTSFDSGEYDQTAIEKITPVDILYHGYGYSNKRVTMKIPDSVRSHPIWQISPDPEKNETILDLHPAFLGFHDIQRAKPGATLLGLREDGEGALIAVQNYGKGRSLAFLSDTNGAWARSYVTWQNPSAEAFTEGGHRELGHGAGILYKADKVQGAGPADTEHPAEYMGRFWVNVVRWLGEKSLRLEEQSLLARSEMMVVEPGGVIRLSAEVLAGIDPSTLPDVKVTANLVGRSEETTLRWDRELREFVGELEVPTNVKGSLVEVLVKGHTSQDQYVDQLRLGLLRRNPEMENSAPNEELMRDLARATGGEILNESASSVKVLEAAREEVKAAKVSFRQPVWGRWDVFFLLIGLLGGEWLLRRYLAK